MSDRYDSFVQDVKSNPYPLYARILGEPKKEDSRNYYYCYRDEKTPSFLVDKRDGKCTDFGGSGRKNGPFDLVGDKYNLPEFHAQIEKARELMNIPQSSTSTKRKAPARTEAIIKNFTTSVEKSTAPPVEICKPKVPAPADMPPPDFDPYKKAWGRPDEVYTLLNPDGSLFNYDYRWNYPPGETRKQFKPCYYYDAHTYNKKRYPAGWYFRGSMDNKPLYRAVALAEGDMRPVVIVEGYNTMRAVEVRFPDHLAITWQGSATSWQKSDWSLLANRKDVLLWPDADKPGKDAMAGIQEHLRAMNTVARIVDTAGLPPGHDLADTDPDPAGYSYQKRLEAAVVIDIAPAPVEEWPELIPLCRTIAPEPFPLHCLEHPLHQQLVEALAHESECPVDLAVTQSLPTIAAVIQARAKYHVTHLERPCIYAVGLAASGDRKSPIERALSGPLQRIFSERLRDYKSTVAEGAEASEIRKDKIKNLKKQAAKAKDPKEASNTLAMIKELREEESKVAPPQPLVATEGTGAGIKRAMMRPGADETLFLSDSEARVIEILFGGAFDGGGEADTDIITKAYTGDKCVGLRGRDDSVQGVISSPTLSIGLIVQARMAESFFRHESSTYKGSIARFLWSWPVTMAGKRTFTTPQCPPELLAWWDGLIRNLYECSASVNEYGEKQLYELGAAPGAVAVWRKFMQEIEPDRDPETGGFAMDGEAMLSWAGKLEGHVIRIAIALHAILHGSGYVERPISEKTMGNAITITRYYISHARRVFLGYSVDPVTADAKRVLVWIQKAAAQAQGQPATLRMVNDKGLNHWDEARKKAAISRLEAHGYIQTEALKPADKARATTIFRLNPQISESTESLESTLSGGTKNEC